jgi:hypothetical protein
MGLTKGLVRIYPGSPKVSQNPNNFESYTLLRRIQDRFKVSSAPGVSSFVGPNPLSFGLLAMKPL